uniref:Uncharacterized protein n=1 Tax=Aegilops tauschii subsp. strangulata TaxID=200361 RepID=A0A452ZDT3_AEGTS
MWQPIILAMFSEEHTWHLNKVMGMMNYLCISSCLLLLFLYYKRRRESKCYTTPVNSNLRNWYWNCYWKSLAYYS